MIKVIIFDLDGLLIDSQPLQHKAYHEVFSKHGYPISKEQWRDWINFSGRVQDWVEKENLSLDPEKLRIEKKVIYDKLIKEELNLKLGAENIIDLLSKKFRLCIASSSRIESIESIVKKFGLESKFEKLISDSKMGRGKPEPTVFLKAAELMKASPEECIVIEDSAVGLKAAKSAKMKCIVCPDCFYKVESSKIKTADKIVNNLNEISIFMINNL